MVRLACGCGAAEAQVEPTLPSEPMWDAPLDVRFVITLPAVVLWGATQRAKNHEANARDRAYRQLLGRPEMLEVEECGFRTDSMEDFWECARAHVADEEQPLVIEMLDAVVRDIEPRWNQHREPLRYLALLLTDFLVREDAQASLDEIRAHAGAHVFDRPIRVVLVPDTLAERGRATHLLGFARPDLAVLIVPPRLPVTHYFTTLVHELVHVAHMRSNGAPELEEALSRLGEEGTLAASRWTEAFAQAFEARGSSRFNLAAPEGLPYSDETVQAMADVLVARMSEGPLPPLGASLAPVLVEAVEVGRPLSERRLTDHLWRSAIYSTSPEPLAQLLNANELIRAAELHGQLPDDFRALRAHFSALVFATLTELGEHTELLASVGLGLPPAEHANDDVLIAVAPLASGAKAVVVTGQTTAELVSGARYLASRHQRMRVPANGWHRIAELYEEAR